MHGVIIKILSKLQPLNVICILLILTMGSGCSKSLNIRASESLLKENKMNKLAILASGRVEWPREKDGIPVLSEENTREMFELLIPKTREVLKKKGYDVVFAEPVAIAYFNPVHRWINEKQEDDPNLTLDKILNKEPAYEYPILEKDPKMKAAVRSIFESIELAIASGQLYMFNPTKKELEGITGIVDADTLCLLRIYGQRHNLGRKIGISLLTAFYGDPNLLTDMTETTYICIDAKTGNVLWQHSQVVKPDSWGIGETSTYLNLIESTLAVFPDSGKTIPQTCKKLYTTFEIYNCPLE